MKLVKSLLLGSAAGVAAVAGAQAADLPITKAAPVEYVRVCSVHGVGFFYIPGTDTCIRIGGRVRAEYNYATRRDDQGSVSGYRALAWLNLDSRTATAYGTLRAFIRFEMARRTGSMFSGGATRFGEAEFPNSGILVGQAQTQVVLNKAFIQFAGLTAGRATSFYDFYANDHTWITLNMGSDTSRTNLFAYTATFGNGFSATLSIEDPTERRFPLHTAVFQNFGAFGFFVPFPNWVVGGPGGVLTAFPPQPNKVPDIVANIRVDQAWGSAQLSAAVHELDAIGFSNGPAPFTGLRTDSEYGWAIQGGLKFNLPFVAPGDVLYLQAAYSDGAMAYTWGNPLNQTTGLTNRFPVSFAEGVILPDGSIKKTQSWTAVASFLHYWTPSLRQGLFAGYGQVDFSKTLNSFAFGAPLFVGTGLFRDWHEWDIGTNLIWSPVRDLDIGVEVMYKRIDVKGRVFDLNRPVVINGIPITSDFDDQFIARVRVQRDF